MKFDYFSYNYYMFDKAYYKYCDSIYPLYSITDDLLMCMSVDRPYFQIPAHASKDGRTKWFKFKVEGDLYLFEGVYNGNDNTKYTLILWVI